MDTRLICLRHAEAEPPLPDSSSGAAGGARPDPPLTERGRRQAEAVARRLLGARPRAVFVSEALRSRQTGAIIAASCGVPIAVVPALAEVSAGRGEREPIPPGVAADALRRWIVRGDLDLRLMDGETGDEVAARMTGALIEIGAACRGSVGIVVGHVASLTVGVAALCRNGPALWGKPLPHATPFPLTVGGEGWRVRWPDPSHHGDLA